MATLTNEWVSLEQAQAWLTTYDPRWRSDEIVAAIAREMEKDRRPRWGRALLVDTRTDVCVEGLHHLLFLVSRGRGGKRWVARASDFVFSVVTLEPQPDGRMLMVTRREDSVETHAIRMTQVQGNRYLIDLEPLSDAPSS